MLFKDWTFEIVAFVGVYLERKSRDRELIKTDDEVEGDHWRIDNFQHSFTHTCIKIVLLL